MAIAAEQAVAEVGHWPDFSIGRYVARPPFCEPRDRDHIAQGLRKAGLPE
ncbi:MAG: hypothetical protein KIT20_09595 [Alphaproteobacteria bacterium]|nr:hypothetical protein [Alphaproteobacteria bacterium]